MAPHEIESSTSEVHFSMDQGGCWHTVQLEEEIDVQNIRYASSLIPETVRGPSLSAVLLSSFSGQVGSPHGCWLCSARFVVVVLSLNIEVCGVLWDTLRHLSFSTHT